MDIRLHQNAPTNMIKQTKVNIEEPRDKKEEFQKILNQKLLPKVSNHASIRIQERGLEIKPETWSNISEKLSVGKAKGITEALVLTNDAAFVISIKNNTVITAMDLDEAKSQVFTNINGTIIMNE